MSGVRRYRISLIVLISLLTLSSGISIYLYHLQQTNPNSSGSRSPDLQLLQTPDLSKKTPDVLYGAGATFPFPLLSAISADYTQIHPDVQLNYQPVGSGAGIRDLASLTVDFAATDLPLTASQTAAMPGQVLIIPETIGAVVVAYNVPGLSSGLHLNSTIAAKIFLGQITMWNDSGIAQLNPSIPLPNQAITIVHRSDASGTTFVFTGYLNSAPGNIWTLGQGTAVPWPAGIGALGNQGVAAVIQGTPYTIGYMELSYALTNTITYSSLQNADGTNFVQPSLSSITYAVDNATSTTPFPAGDQSWAGVSLLNAKGLDSYPIVSFSYLVVYIEQNILPGTTSDIAKVLTGFLWFVVHDGQAQGPPLGFVPLPTSVVAIDETSIRSMTLNGHTLPH